MSEEISSAGDTKVEGKESSIFAKIAPLLLVLSLVLAFAVGVLWQRVSSLKKWKIAGTEASPTGQQESPISVPNIKKIAKGLGLNEKDFNKCLDDGKYAAEVKKDVTEGEKVGVKGTPAFFINGKFLGGAYPYENFKEIIDKELEGKGKSIKEYSDLLQKAYENAADRSFDITPKKIDAGSSPVKGDAEAKVTLVEFSDFECPFCVRHYTQTYKKLVEEYVDTGKVKIVFKNYPLVFHPQAQKAAEAAECAGEQGKFWEMHDKLFSASASQ